MLVLFNDGTTMAVDGLGTGNHHASHASSNGSQGILNLRHHATADDAFSLQTLEVGSADGADYAGVIIWVAQYASFLKGIDQRYIVKFSHSLCRFLSHGVGIGGFSVYYLAGHHDKRFKAFIAHDGAFNLEAMYTETEENWFSNFEYDDAYWNKDRTANADKTYKNSPHQFVDKWDTPILCIHGEKDYRINATQGMSAFNAARMKGIPAELLIFPDENHWVLKPQNGILWQRTFFDFLGKWLK